MLKNMTVGKKITLGFTLVLAFMVIVGSTGYVSLRNTASEMDAICYQLEIAKKANTILVDAQDAQAASLRYIIYKDTQYNDFVSEESKKVVEGAQEAQKMMKSDENKQLAQNVVDQITAYDKAVGEFYALQLKREQAGKARAAAAGMVLENIRDLLDAQYKAVDACAKDTEQGKVTDYTKVRNTFLAQQARNAFNRVDIAAQKYQLAVDPAEQDALAQAWVAEIEATRKSLTACKTRFKDATALEHLGDALSALDDYLGQVQVFRQINRDQRTVQREKQKPAADAVMTKARDVRDGVYTFIDDVNQRANASVTWANRLIVCVSVCAVLIGIIAAVVITMGVSRALKRIIEGLTASAEQTSAASQQVSGASQSLAQGSSEQAAAVEETSASIEEMASMTKQNAANANEARTLAESARTSADKGAEAMGRMSHAIDDIKKSSDETAKIVKTIDEIAFQTNLLALNAAVEAARAGEAGKGFAVVAEEVRNLAQRSAEAAKTTSELIQGSVSKADNGVGIGREVGSALDEIADGNRKLNDLVSEIASASAEQAQGIEQISTAVSQMDQVTQSNAANAEESASAAEELSAQAAELTNMVGQLEKLVGGVDTARGTGFGHAQAARSHALVPHTAHAETRSAQSATKAQVRRRELESPEDVIPLEDQEALTRF